MQDDLHQSKRRSQQNESRIEGHAMNLKYGLPKQLETWSADNLAMLKPPVGNASVFADGNYIINVVGGPNYRTDFHDNPFEEIFYQLQGDAHIIIWDRGQFERIDLKEGDVFLLPAHVQHSPQRPVKGLCFLVELPRPAHLHDHLRWYCAHCASLVFETDEHLTDLVKDLPVMYRRFYDLEDQARRCPQCGEVHPGRQASAWLEALKSSKATTAQF